MDHLYLFLFKSDVQYCFLKVPPVGGIVVIQGLFCAMMGFAGVSVSSNKNKTSFFFFQIFFIAQIQVAQQYSSLTTQNNSLAATRKAWIHVVKNRSDVSLVQPLIFITLRCWKPCWLVGNIEGLKLPRNKRNLPDGENADKNWIHVKGKKKKKHNSKSSAM